MNHFRFPKLLDTVHQERIAPSPLTSHLTWAMALFVHKQNHGYEDKSRRTQSVLKAKTWSKKPQDFWARVPFNIRQIKQGIPLLMSKDSLMKMLGFPQSFRRGKNAILIRAIRDPKMLPSLSKSSVSLEKNTPPLSVRQAESTMDFVDLKYSDMFKEIRSSDKGPGIYEMFGTPVYSREPTAHENRCCRNVHSAPARRLSVTKHKSNNLSKESRARNTQRTTYPKPHGNPQGIKGKHQDLMSRKASKLEGSGQEQSEGTGTSNAEGQRNISRNSMRFYENEAQELSVSTELTPSAKPSEVIPNTCLAAIEEVSLEHSSGVDDDDGVQEAFVNSIRELLWPQVKDHAKYAPFLSSARETNENNSLDNSKFLNRGRTEAPDCLVDQEDAIQDLCGEDNQGAASVFSSPGRVSTSSDQNIQQGNVILTNASTQWTYHSTSPFSQTYQTILRCMNNEEIMEELFCCPAAELLSLDGADAGGSRVVMKSEKGDASKGCTGNKEATATNDVNHKVSIHSSLNNGGSGGPRAC